MLEVSQGRQGSDQGEATHGGFANGMPRNLFIPLDVEPINDPLSSVTVVVGSANTVETTAHRVKREALRNLILGDEKLRTVAQVRKGGSVLGGIPATSTGFKWLRFGPT
jgi:hypothetical protein